MLWGWRKESREGQEEGILPDLKRRCLRVGDMGAFRVERKHAGSVSQGSRRMARAADSKGGRLGSQGRHSECHSKAQKQSVNSRHQGDL